MLRALETASTATLQRLLRAKVLLVEKLRPTDLHYLLALAAVVGVVGAIGAHWFRLATGAVHAVMTGVPGGYVESFAQMPWWRRILVPALGGALAGGVLHLGARISQSQRSSDYMEAIVVGDGHISFKKSAVRSLSALLSGASGASIGREGPLVQISAMLASLPGRWLQLSLPMRRQLVACGAAAGIASAYNAPIAGALFVAEVVLGSLSVESFGPLVMASVAATLTTRALEGSEALYGTAQFVMGSTWELVPYAAMGCVFGLLAPLYLRFLRLCTAAFQKLPIHDIACFVLGGAIVGVLAVGRPEVCGNGYSVLYSVLHSSWSVQALLAVLVLKVVATGATFGSGAVGGVFTPTLLTGGVLGYLFASAAALLPWFGTLHPNAGALVGTGAFLAAATGAPVMAILMVFELTLDYEIILPLMLACVLSFSIARTFESRFLYGDTLARKGAGALADAIRNARVADLIRPGPVVVGTKTPFREIAQTFLQHRFNYLYVVTEDKHFQGAIALHDIKVFLGRPEISQLLIAKDIQDEHFPFLTADTPLHAALEAFQRSQSERLPVVDSAAHRHLIGSLSKTDLLLHLMGHVRQE